jgi:hypothetical protein
MSRESIMFDLYSKDPVEDKLYLTTRIWLTPHSLKHLRDDLDNTLRHYERDYGKIKKYAETKTR